MSEDSGPLRESFPRRELIASCTTLSYDPQFIPSHPSACLKWPENSIRVNELKDPTGPRRLEL